MGSGVAVLFYIVRLCFVQAQVVTADLGVEFLVAFQSVELFLDTGGFHAEFSEVVNDELFAVAAYIPPVGSVVFFVFGESFVDVVEEFGATSLHGFFFDGCTVLGCHSKGHSKSHG